MDQPPINQPTPQGGNSPFEMPPNIAAPEPMGQQKSAPGQPSSSYQNRPVAPQEPPAPKKPIFSYIIIFFLIIILVVGILFFAAWKDWISLGGLFQKPTPSPIVTFSPKVSPAISSVLPTSSPTVTSSPETLTNVNDQTRKQDLAKIKNGLKDYFSSKGEYPPSVNIIKTTDQTSVLAQALVPTYLESLSDDPLAPQYYYGYKSDGQIFELTAVLEDKSDPSGTITGSYNIYKITDSSVE